MKNRYRVISMLLILVITCVVCVPCRQQQATAKGKNTPKNIGEISYSEIDEKNIKVNEVGVSFVDNELMVVAKEGVIKSEVEALAQSYDCKIVGSIELTNDYQWRFNSTYSYNKLEEIAERIEKENIIEDATIKMISQIEKADFTPPNDKEWIDEWAQDGGDNWGVEKINAHKVWEKKDKMTPIRIGLIDEMYETHNDLQGVTAEIIRDPFYIKSNSHGNHVAGIMAAEHNNNEGIAGVYPWGKGPDGTPYVYATTKSVDGQSGYGRAELYQWKVVLAELISRNVKVINISSSTSLNAFLSTYEETRDEYLPLCQRDSRLLGDFLEKFLDKGYDFIITQAAGNSKVDTFRKLTTGQWIRLPFGSTDDRSYEVSVWGDEVENMANRSHYFAGIENPKVKDRIVVVGATEYRVDGKNNITDYCNSGNRIDVMAPGDSILSCVLKNGYSYKSGTSMATPHVAGAAACIWSYNTKLTGAQVKEILVNSSKGEDRKVQNADAGIIDVNLALESIENDISGEPTPRDHVYPVIGRTCDYENEKNIPDATVKFYKTTGEYVLTTTSNEEGVFKEFLEEGSYKVVVSAKKYRTKTVDEIIVKKLNTTYVGLVFLKEIKPAIDTVLLLDLSPSVPEKAMSKMVKIAMEYCKDVGQTEVEKRVAIIGFTDNVVCYTPFTNQFVQLDDGLSQLTLGKLTDLRAGLDVAAKHHETKGTEGAVKNIIIMTDSLPNTGGVSHSSLMEGKGYYIPYDNAVLDKLTEMGQKYNVYSIGFTEGLEGEALENCQKLTQKMTNVSGGYFLVDENTSTDEVTKELILLADKLPFEGLK